MSQYIVVNPTCPDVPLLYLASSVNIQEVAQSQGSGGDIISGPASKVNTVCQLHAGPGGCMVFLQNQAAVLAQDPLTLDILQHWLSYILTSLPPQHYRTDTLHLLDSRSCPHWCCNHKPCCEICSSPGDPALPAQRI